MSWVHITFGQHNISYRPPPIRAGTCSLSVICKFLLEFTIAYFSSSRSAMFWFFARKTGEIPWRNKPHGRVHASQYIRVSLHSISLIQLCHGYSTRVHDRSTRIPIRNFKQNASRQQWWLWYAHNSCYSAANWERRNSSPVTSPQEYRWYQKWSGCARIGLSTCHASLWRCCEHSV